MTPRPVRALHVLWGGKEQGGVETWVRALMRLGRRESVERDVLFHGTGPCDYEPELRSLGARVHRCSGALRSWGYSDSVRKVLQNEGPYDAIHCHLHYFSGVVLRIAKKAGIPIRIAHSHMNLAAVANQTGLLKRLYRRYVARGVSRHATHGLAVSRNAAVDLFGTEWESDPRWGLIAPGIDFTPFRSRVMRAELRTELGVPVNALTVGHVGVFTAEKNHLHLLASTAAAVRANPRVHLLLFGDGALRPQIQAAIAAAGIDRHVTLLGYRRDIERMLLGAVDVFVFPSTSEGFGQVVLQAQAAGLRCVVSDGVPTEVDVVPDAVRRLPLSAGPERWAQAILATAALPPLDQSASLRVLERSPFSIEQNLALLEDIYRGRAFKLSL